MARIDLIEEFCCPQTERQERITDMREDDDLGSDFDFEFGAHRLTNAQFKALDQIDRWDGDLPPDLEHTIGCTGAAFDAVIGALMFRKLIIEGAWGTYPLTEKGQTWLTKERRLRKATA